MAADFEANLVDGPPCVGSAYMVHAHYLTVTSLASSRAKSHPVTYNYQDLPKDMQFGDIPSLAKTVSIKSSTEGGTGRVLAMWATQFCGAHVSGDGIFDAKIQLEKIGAWFFPETELGVTPQTVSVTREEPYKEPKWWSTANRMGRRGQPRCLGIEGLSLPRTPSEQSIDAHAAVLLATVGRKSIYGLLHKDPATNGQIAETLVYL